MSCPSVRHGTPWAYRAGCRCPESREAWRLYCKRRREGRQPPLILDSTGTRRRIQGMWWLGHNSATIGQAAGGITADQVGDLTRRSRVQRRTMEAIRQAYEALSMTAGSSTHTRSRALAAGCSPPLAWDDNTIDDPDAKPYQADPDTTDDVDEVAVEAACAGSVPWARLLTPERTEAVSRLTRLGLDDRQIADRLRAGRDTVAKHRERHGIPTGWRGAA